MIYTVEIFPIDEQFKVGSMTNKGKIYKIVPEYISSIFVGRDRDGYKPSELDCVQVQIVDTKFNCYDVETDLAEHIIEFNLTELKEGEDFILDEDPSNHITDHTMIGLMKFSNEKNWEDAKNLFYIENDANIQHWSDTKQLALRLLEWLGKNYLIIKT